MEQALETTVHGVLALFSNGRETPPTAERHLVNLTIAFANRGKLRGSLGIVAQRSKTKGSRKREAERQELRARFDQLTDATNRTVETGNGKQFRFVAGFELIREDAHRILIVPSFRFDQHEKLLIEHHYVPEDLSAMLSYVFMLFLDTSRPYGDDLFKCQLDRCGRYFFAKRPKTGRPRTKYCKPDHMQQAHDANSSFRVARSRRIRDEKKRLAAKNGRRRRR